MTKTIITLALLVMASTASAVNPEINIISRTTPPMTTGQNQILNKAIANAWYKDTPAECAKALANTMNVPAMKPSDYILTFAKPDGRWIEFRINLRGADSAAFCTAGR